MADRVKMTAKTTFQNTRISGPANGIVNDGDTFETDPQHAKDLVRLGHADPVEGGVHDIPDAPLEPHHQISERALVADRVKREASGRRGRERTDGPTVEQYVASGYRAENYPPDGYASRSTPAEITAAVAAQSGK